jgi:hypothetical protein
LDIDAGLAVVENAKNLAHELRRMLAEP